MDEAAHPDYSRTIRCTCMKESDEKQRMEQLLIYCQLPASASRKTFKTFIKRKGTEEAYDASVEMAEGSGIKWLTLVSKADMGKSHLALAICQRWVERGIAARYIKVPILLDELRRGIARENNTPESYESKFKFFMTVPLLALDDLGTERPTPWVTEQLIMIIDYRYDQELPLLVTSNKPLTELPGDDEHRIASRLQRFIPGKVVELKGKEFRIYNEHG